MMRATPPTPTSTRKNNNNNNPMIANYKSIKQFLKVWSYNTITNNDN